MKKWMTCSAALLLFLALSQIVDAGVLYARRPGTESPVFNLRISHIRTHVRIQGQLAVTHVDEEFFNDNSEVLEGFYAFQLPDGAKVDGLWLWVDGVRRTFVVKTTAEAQRLYDSVVVGQRRDPAILESLGMNRFQLKVFPINPRSSRRIEIRYFNTLPLTTDGWVHYRYPLNLSGYQSRAVESTNLHIDVASHLPIDALNTNFDDQPLMCRVAQLDERRSTIDFGIEDQMYTQDFELRYKPRGVYDVFPMLSYTNPDSTGEDPYFICWHPVQLEETEAPPRDLVFVLDASGSMAGTRIDMVRQAVIGILQELRPSDRFRLTFFSSGVSNWPNTPDGMVEASSENIQAGISHINRYYSATGGTNYEIGIRGGYDANFRRDAVRKMLFLSDGEPNAGIYSLQGLKSIIETIDTVGVVFNPVIVFSSRIELLYDLAEARGGKVTMVESGDDLQTVLSRIMLDLNVGSTLAPEVRYELRNTMLLYPLSFNGITSANKLVTTGRWLAPNERVTVNYSDASGTARSLSRDVRFVDWSTDLPQVASYWAAARIDDLLATIKKYGETLELKQSVIALSMRHQILTPYTAFLVLETNQIDPPTNNNHIGTVLPQSVQVGALYPNPYTSGQGAELYVPIELPERGALRVVLTDILGRELAVLHDAVTDGGRLTLRWNGLLADGSALKPGMYLLRVTNGANTIVRKLMILR